MDINKNNILYCYQLLVPRLFRNMDDDGSKSLNYEEFKKGITEYNLGGYDESVSCVLSQKLP